MSDSFPYEASHAIDKALELDPTLGEAYASRGFALIFHAWSWKEAEENLKRAIELNPGYATAHQWYANLLGITGHLSEAKAEMRRALEIDPRSPNFLADMGQLHYLAHEYDDAESYCQRALELNPDSFANGYLFQVYFKRGEHDRAVEKWLLIAQSSGLGAYSDYSSAKMEAYVAEKKALYDRSGTVAFWQSFIDDWESSPTQGNLYGLAVFHMCIGDKGRALDYLEKAFSARFTAFNELFLKADPVFDDLHAEPRFQEILRRMNLADS